MYVVVLAYYCLSFYKQCDDGGRECANVQRVMRCVFIVIVLFASNEKDGADGRGAND